MLAYIFANPILPYGVGYVRFHLGTAQETAQFDLTQVYSRTEVNPPQNRKNVIIIYLEGLERTYRHETLFGDAYRPLRDLEASGVEFTEIAQISNTEWTIAGMVASQCGVPLSTPGMFSAQNIRHREDYLPNTVCLGDVLSDQGYTQEFILGSPPGFARKDRYYARHGFDSLIGRQMLSQMASDHLGHENNMTEVLETMERRNTVMMFGAGITPRRIDKPGAMIDIFPTILDVLGVDLPNDRAGLGVSLFSDSPTLVEQFGIKALDTVLMYDTRLAEELWAEE